MTTSSTKILIYGGEAAIKELCVLFNLVLHHERTPSQWTKNVLVPIFKGKGKSKSDPGSNRPVSLMPCLSKLFEKIVLKRLNSALTTARPNFPNPQQQGFRKHLSCITTSFNLQETIFHQIEQNSNVYVGMLDQRAAFDVVWHSGLF